MQEIEIAPMSPARFRTVLPLERFDQLERAAATARRLLEGRGVWNINSTARGGGVVELLQPLLAYARGVGIDARWVVIEGPPEFFAVASRIGGIEEQIVHGETGILLDNPYGLPAFGTAVTELLINPDETTCTGQRARERVRDRFTSIRNLLDYAALIKRLVGPSVDVSPTQATADAAASA